MEPIREQPTGSDLPKAVTRARIVMYVQAAAAVLVPLIIAIATGGPDDSETEESRARGLAFLIVIIIAVALAVLATKLKNRKPSVRKWSLGVEWLLVAFAILSLVQGGFGSIVSLALAGYVIYELMSRDAKAAFGGAATATADAKERFDIRDFPDV